MAHMINERTAGGLRYKIIKVSTPAVSGKLTKYLAQLALKNKKQKKMLTQPVECYLFDLAYCYPEDKII